MIQQSELKLDKQRDFSDVLNASFRFIKQEFKGLFGTAFLYTIIPFIAAGLMAVYYSANNFKAYVQGILNNQSEVVAPDFGMFGLMMLFSFLAHILIMGITCEYMAMYHKHGRGNFTTSDVARALAKDMLSIVGYLIVVSIVLFFAFWFFFIPMIYLMVPLSMIIMVRVAERNGFSASWGRCFKLIKDNWWATFGLLFVASIIISIVSLVFQLPITIYAAIQGLTALEMDPDATEFNRVLVSFLSVVSTVGSGMLYVIYYVIIGFQYFSLSSQKENTTLIDRINQIGETTNESI